MANRLLNRQILTRRSGPGRKLETMLVEKPLRPLATSEVLLEVLMVPLHGSFWLASHPDGLHPRFEEFIADGAFVFGNGGVGRVLETGPDCRRMRVGDYVSVMGHLPCRNDDCHGCRVLHRYTECDFGEGLIVGHGKGAPDGTYADYCIIDEIACEVCFQTPARPSELQLLPFMFAFLLADVRNAMTRDSDTLQRQRMLLIGAGYSGHLAAWLLLHTSPGAKILVADTQQGMLESIKQLAPDSIRTVLLPDQTGTTQNEPVSHETIASLERAAAEHFGRRRCDLIFDASSGNTTWLWANTQLLAPGCQCIPFGFASEHLLLDKACLQVSGLKILTSRGVGDLDNRRLAVELIHRGAVDRVAATMSTPGCRLAGLDTALDFIHRQHAMPGSAQRAPRAYISPRYSS